MANDTRKKSSAGLRKFLSFVIYFLLVALSFSACSSAVFTNTQSVKEAFTGYEYVSGLRNNVMEYARDVYMKNGISCENLEKIFEYSAVETISDVYIGTNISHRAGYSEEIYLTEIEKICSKLEDDIRSHLDEMKIKYDGKDVDKAIKVVNDYFVSEIKIPYIQYVKTVTNLGSVVSIVLTVLSAVFTVAVCAITFFVGRKRYRALRSVALGFMSAGLFDMLVSLMAFIIMQIKHVDVYPLYLQNTFHHFVNLCIGSVAVVGSMLLVISFVIITVVWRLKKKDK